LASIAATGLGVALMYASKEKLLEYQISVQPTIDFMTSYVVLVLLAMMLLGAVIGIISSLLATRRYLKG